MSSAIDGLKPPLVWKYFAELARIPRCSKHEAAAARFVVDTAKRLGLAVKQDKVGNVIVKKPASAGHAHRKSVCLQGHLDMVCEKNAGTTHDFSKDPIELVRRGDVMMANGTTLGADNGVAVATNLAIMEDKSLEHGPLEFLFTIDEETGLTGAHNLGPGFVESRTLLNLDSEEEGALYVGCAGGQDTVGTWKVEVEPAAATLTALEVTVSGLKGGHSGLEIDKGRGNALKILNRVVIALGDLGARLAADQRRQQAQRHPARGPGARVRAQGEDRGGAGPRRRVAHRRPRRAGHRGARPRGDGRACQEARDRSSRRSTSGRSRRSSPPCRTASPR